MYNATCGAQLSVLIADSDATVASTGHRYVYACNPEGGCWHPHHGPVLLGLQVNCYAKQLLRR